MEKLIELSGDLYYNITGVTPLFDPQIEEEFIVNFYGFLNIDPAKFNEWANEMNNTEGFKFLQNLEKSSEVFTSRITFLACYMAINSPILLTWRWPYGGELLEQLFYFMGVSTHNLPF